MIGFDCRSLESLRPLPQEFFNSDVETVARALIGAFLYNVDEHGTAIGGRIVENRGILPSRSRRALFRYRRPLGKRYPRRFFDSMYLTGGHVYVYNDGPKYCYLNLTCGELDYGSAVLINRARIASIR